MLNKRFKVQEPPTARSDDTILHKLETESHVGCGQINLEPFIKLSINNNGGNMNESAEYQDLRRQEIQLARLRAKWGRLKLRVTAKWLQGCPAPMLAELLTLWQLEWNVEDNMTSSNRYQRALHESRRRMIKAK